MSFLLEVILPSMVLFTTLFGLLSRGHPKPGGVALFGRVGGVGLLFGALLWYLTSHTEALASTPVFVKRMYGGLIGGGALLVAFALFGASLKKKR